MWVNCYGLLHEWRSIREARSGTREMHIFHVTVSSARAEPDRGGSGMGRQAELELATTVSAGESSSWAGALCRALGGRIGVGAHELARFPSPIECPV